jgi:hypothetical protein
MLARLRFCLFKSVDHFAIHALEDLVRTSITVADYPQTKLPLTKDYPVDPRNGSVRDSDQTVRRLRGIARAVAGIGIESHRPAASTF